MRMESVLNVVIVHLETEKVEIQLRGRNRHALRCSDERIISESLGMQSPGVRVCQQLVAATLELAASQQISQA